MAEASNKVYIVTQGEYSDYHIVTVFMDRHDAEVYCAMQNRGNIDYWGYSISEYNVGKVVYPPDVEIGYLFAMGINGRMRLVGNFTKRIGKNVIVPNIVKASTDCRGTEYEVGVMATSMEQATKIAQDLIAKYKAEKEGL